MRVTGWVVAFGLLALTACSQQQIDHAHMKTIGMNTAWEQGKFSYADARKLEKASITPEDAVTWRAMGMSADETMAWNTAGYTPGTARPFVNAGLKTPDQVKTWQAVHGTATLPSGHASPD